MTENLAMGDTMSIRQWIFACRNPLSTLLSRALLSAFTAFTIDTTALTAQALWGWADLHAHPAAHMSFGANTSGEGGIFWGKPGMAFATSNPDVDMPICATDSHYGFDTDPVRKETRRTVIRTLDGLTGWSHGASGSPSFANWPNSQSLNHQQMHIQAIRRAYDGGLRLMFASTTDNEMLSNLWTKVGFNLSGNPVPAVDPNFDFNSAKRQFDFIKREVAANSSWMKVVYSAAEARRAILENKLAVVLSVEFDSLTYPQIAELVRDYGVRHVIPIHLADNSFGGTAVFSDVFNSSNNYLWGRPYVPYFPLPFDLFGFSTDCQPCSFFRVLSDPLLQFRLGRPSVLHPAEFGSIKPLPVSDSTFNTLGYAAGTSGHRNSKALNVGEFLKLMRLGVMLDVVHMSEAATGQAVALSRLFRYPMMDSHTGLRDEAERAHSERSLKRDHAQKLAAEGGVLGLGTEGTSSDRVLLDVRGGPVVRFTGAVHRWSRFVGGSGTPGAEIFKLRVTLTTGADDLRGGSDNVTAYLTLTSGARFSFPNINQSQPWGGGVRRTIDLPIPPGIGIHQLSTLGLVTAFRGGIDGDNWNVDEIRLVATERQVDPVATWLAEYKSATRIMGHGKVALGTDINGFAPQVPFSAAPVRYPLEVARVSMARRLSEGWPGRILPPLLAQSRFGSRTYDFNRDGIAHYGMLADFVQALSQQPDSAAAIDGLFRSAEETVRMWEGAERAAGNVH